MHRCIGKPLRVEVSLPRQAENDVGKLEAGGLYGLGPLADGWGNPIPGIVESLAERLQLIGAVRPARNNLPRLHAPAAPLQPSFRLPQQVVNCREEAWGQARVSNVRLTARRRPPKTGAS